MLSRIVHILHFPHLRRAPLPIMMVVGKLFAEILKHLEMLLLEFLGNLRAYRNAVMDIEYPASFRSASSPSSHQEGNKVFVEMLEHLDMTLDCISAASSLSSHQEGSKVFAEHLGTLFSICCIVLDLHRAPLPVENPVISLQGFSNISMLHSSVAYSGDDVAACLPCG